MRRCRPWSRLLQRRITAKREARKNSNGGETNQARGITLQRSIAGAVVSSPFAGAGVGASDFLIRMSLAQFADQPGRKPATENNDHAQDRIRNEPFSDRR